MAVRSGLATAQSRFAPTDSRQSSTASSRSRSAKRGQQCVRTGHDLVLVEVVDGRDTEVLGEQALLRRHVHHEIMGGEPVLGDDVERGVGKLGDGACHPIREREIDVDHRIRSALTTFTGRVEGVGAQTSRRLRGFGGTDPRGGARQPVGLAGQIGASSEDRFDRGDLLGLAGVERVRTQHLLDVELGETERLHHSPRSDSSASAMRRNASRRRDLAVPSGIPSVSATCR